MAQDNQKIVVLRAKAHGISQSEYASALRERVSVPVVTARTPHEERTEIEEASIATGLEFDPDLFQYTDGLRLFACGAAGTGHLPMDEFEERGVVVTNASGVHAPNIAEHVIASLLIFARRLHRVWRQQERREWRHIQAFGELEGSTVTIVGQGAIGRAVAERLRAFNVDTVGIRYTPEKGGPTDEVIGYDEEEIHDAFARTDYLVVACPLTETTEGLIGTDEFLTLPPHAVVVNVARGPIIETDALVAALRSYNQIRGAALDVTAPEPLPAGHPLWRLENVFLTPHLSGHTPDYWERTADILAQNVERIQSTDGYRDLENQVLPATD